MGHRRQDRAVNDRRPSVILACAAALAVAALASPEAAAEDPKAQAILKTVDTAVAAGPVRGRLAVARALRGAGVVPRRQVRHLHPLGRLLRAGLRQRVVPAQHVPAGHARVRAPRRDLRPAVDSSATRTSSRSSRPSSSTPAQWARALQGGRARSSSCRWPSTTTASRCTTAASPSGRAAKMGPEARHRRRARARRSGRAGLVFGLSSHRAEHWWFFDGGMEFDSDVQDPRYAALLRPGAPQKKAEDKSEPPDAGVPRRLAGAHRRAGRQVPAAARLVRLVDRAAGLRSPTCSASPPSTTTAAPSGARASRSTTRTRPSPRRPPCSTSSAASCRASGPMFWQTDTSVSKNSWGYVAKQDYKTAGAIVDDLVDIVSKNGALLLNIGPRPDGTIPEPEQEILREIGRWLTIERRGDLRHAPVGGVRRRADRGRGRQLQRHQAPGLHRRRTSASRRSRAPSTRSRSRGRGRPSP